MYNADWQGRGGEKWQSASDRELRELKQTQKKNLYEHTDRVMFLLDVRNEWKRQSATECEVENDGNAC